MIVNLIFLFIFLDKFVICWSVQNGSLRTGIIAARLFVFFAYLDLTITILSLGRGLTCILTLILLYGANHFAEHEVYIIDTPVILLQVAIFDLKNIELSLRLGLLFSQCLFDVIH